MNEARETIRLDKWLWHARFFKTRSLATKIVSEGKVRVNGTRTSKLAAQVGAGDTLTFSQEKQIRVVRVVAPGARRGPAPEAQALYEDLQPPEPRENAPKNPAFEGKGRPTKRDRRNLDLKRSDALE